MSSNLCSLRDDLVEYAHPVLNSEDRIVAGGEALYQSADQVQYSTPHHGRSVAQFTTPLNGVLQQRQYGQADAVQNAQAWHGRGTDRRGAQGQGYHQSSCHHQALQAYAEVATGSPERQFSANPQGCATLIAGHHFQEQVYEGSFTAQQPQYDFLEVPASVSSQHLSSINEPQLEPDIFLPSSPLENQLDRRQDGSIQAMSCQSSVTLIHFPLLTVTSVPDGPSIYYSGLIYTLEQDDSLPSNSQISHPGLNYDRGEEHIHEPSGTEGYQSGSGEQYPSHPCPPRTSVDHFT